MSLSGQCTGKWNGDWIRLGWGDGAPLLRKSFHMDRPVRRAEVRVSALGVCELRLNGSRVGQSHLLPGWTDYRKRIYYHSFDVTGQLQAGENVIGGIIAPGWFAGHYGPFGDKGYYGHDAWFSTELAIDYVDGSRETICSDTGWKGTEGPIIEADLLMGESYDARLEIPGWDKPDFDDCAWKPVQVIDHHEQLPELIEPYPGAPVTTVAELPAQTLFEPKPGVYVFDLGQNMVGVVRLCVNVPHGTEIVLRHGEMLDLNGSVYTENLRSARAVDRYIAKGGSAEVWQPRFTFHGFRYVEVTGLPEPPPIETVTGVVWMSGLRETASFECSNEKVNRLFSNIQWSFRGNYLEVPSDCPQRDERLGWTGDAQLFMRSASYLADIRPFYRKWLVDLHDAQDPNGGYPDMAPYMGRMGFASAAWADAGIICPYVLWKAYGTTEFIRAWWPWMKQYMGLICTDGNRHNGPDAVSYGDWLHFNSDTPVRLIGLAYRAYDARLMEEMALALGEPDDARHFQIEAERSRALFRASMFEQNSLSVTSQTACALAIAMELLDGSDLEQVAQCLVRCLEKTKGYLTTGFIGTAYLCPALTRINRSELAVGLLLNEGYPSWLYEVNNGATTIWERWDGWTADRGFGDVGMNSFNHYAFGSVCEWLFESLAGIKPGAPGFATLELAPCLTSRLDYVKASFESVQGCISVHWKRTEDGFEIELESPVPVHVRLPALDVHLDAGYHVLDVMPNADLITA